MLLYCKSGRVIATHDEAQGLPASAYGDGVTTMPAPAGYVLIPGETDDVPDLDEDGLVAYAASKRRAVIAAGCVVTVAGVEVPTWADAASQGALTALVVAAGINPAITTTWKGRDGLFYELNASDISQLALGVMAFVQTAFAIEAAALAGIDGETITDVAGVDALAWPASD